MKRWPPRYPPPFCLANEEWPSLSSASASSSASSLTSASASSSASSSSSGSASLTTSSGIQLNYEKFMNQRRTQTKSEFDELNPLFRVVLSETFRNQLKNCKNLLEYNTSQLMYYSKECQKYWKHLTNIRNTDDLLEREYFGKYTESYVTYNIFNWIVKEKLFLATVYYSCDVTLKSNHYDRKTEIDLLFFNNGVPIAMVEVKSTSCGKHNEGFHKIARYRELIKNTNYQVVKLKEVFNVPCYVFLATFNKKGNFTLNCMSSKVDFQKQLPRDVCVVENNVEELLKKIFSI